MDHNDVVTSDDSDWRLTGQERVLANRQLRWMDWRRRPGWDHDHCSFCWAEISDRPIDGHTELNAAWVTTDDEYYWVCPGCFEDFREQFGWSIS